MVYTRNIYIFAFPEANMTDDFEDVPEEDVYSEDGVEELLDDDELSAAEEGFMRGYESDI